MKELPNRKKCNTCLEFFPATEKYFIPQKGCKDGLRPLCRTCNKQVMKDRYQNLPTTTVTCQDCGLAMERNARVLSTWQGRCRSCAQKFEKGKPEMRDRLRQNARKQVLQQGGIPNAKKFEGFDRPEDHPRWKGGKPKCIDCGIECSAYTSIRCRECQSKVMPKGEEHPQWKGGITPENHRIRTSTEYKHWRMQVFQRDRFSCVMCNYRSKEPKDIRADHIKPFHLFPDLRFDVDNGRTLCVPCDKIHGYNFFRDRQILLLG